jgi:hypothetical protein
MIVDLFSVFQSDVVLYNCKTGLKQVLYLFNRCLFSYLIITFVFKSITGLCYKQNDFIMHIILKNILMLAFLPAKTVTFHSVYIFFI